MSKYSVLFIQLPHPSFPDRNIPLSSAFLIAAIDQHPTLRNNFDLSILDPQITNHGGDQKIINSLLSKKPDIIAVSLYLWNQKRTLYILNEIKRQMPRCTIIAGGPEIYPESELINSKSPVDIFTFGEGEIVFEKILESLLKTDFELKEISNAALNINGKIKFGDAANEIYDLQNLKLPFHNGILDFNSYDSQSIFLYTMRGCPFACSYCSWSGTGKLRPFNIEEIFSELDYLYRRAASDNIVIKIFIMDSAFNLSPIFEDVCHYIRKINFDRALEFGCFVEAEYINIRQAELLAKANFTYVETGFQSISNDVLKNVNRRLNRSKYERGIRALQNQNLFVLGDIIVGLPGDTKDNIVNGIDYLMELGISVNIFAFSIGNRYLIAEKCRDFEISKQADPPYYISSSNTLSYNDIKSLHKDFKEHIVDFDFNARIYFDYPNEHGSDQFEHQIKVLREKTIKNVESLVFDCNTIDKYSNATDTEIDFYAKNIGVVCTILIKGDYILENLDSIKNILKIIIGSNPFSRLVILFEPDIPFENIDRLDAFSELSDYVASEFYYNKNSLFPVKLESMIAKDFGVYLILPLSAMDKSIPESLIPIYKLTIIDSKDLEEFIEIFTLSRYKQYLVDDTNNIIKLQFDDFCRITAKGLLENNLYFTDDVLQNKWKAVRGVPVRKVFNR